MEAVSPGSVKSSEETNEPVKMEIDEAKPETEEVTVDVVDENKENIQIDKDSESQMSGVIDLTSRDSVMSIDKSTIPLPTEGIKLENIPLPKNSPPQVEIKNIELPRDPYPITQIPLPDEIPPQSQYFKPLLINSESECSESDSSIIRNMSPLTPVRNFDEDNSCDAKQGFDNNEDVKKATSDGPINPSSFRFTIESSNDYKNGSAYKESPKKEETLTKKFESQVKINADNTVDEESSNSNNLHIDYESDSNNKTDVKLEIEQNSEDSRKGKVDEKKGHKSSYHSKDRHSSSKDRKYDSKHSSKDKQDSRSKDKGKSRDESRTRDENKSKSSKDSSSDRKDNKDRDSSKHRHSSSHRSSSSNKDSKSKSSSSSQKSSSRYDDKKFREKSSETKREHKSSSHLKSSKSDKDRKGLSSSSSKSKDDKKKDKKVDDHYSLSGRGNINRRSTDRDSNDGNSSSSKGFNNSSSKATDNKGSKASSSKSDNTPSSSEGNYPSDKDSIVEAKDAIQKPIRVDTHLETPISMTKALKLPEMVLKKPRIASNFKEAQEMVKMRKFLDEEQRRMNQEAALLLEFHANVRPNLSQVYSNISGPELEFACLKGTSPNKVVLLDAEDTENKNDKNAPETNKMIEDFLNNTTNEDVEVMDNTDESQIEDEHDDLESHLKSYSISRNEPRNVKETVPPTKSDSKGSDQISMILDLESNEGKPKEVVKGINADSPAEPDEIEILIPAHFCGVQGDITDNIEVKQNKKQKQSYVEASLTCFGELDKYNAEIEKDKFTKFFRNYKKTFDTKKKLFAVNCSAYAIDLLKDLTKNPNDCEIVSYYKNGHSKVDEKTKPIKNLETEVLPITEISKAKSIQKLESPKIAVQSPIPTKRPQLLSPSKSECSFELSSDYDAKLDELMNTTSRQQIMEIIFGGVISNETAELMHIDICNESNIDICNESSIEFERPAKRSFEEIDGFETVEENVNNNTVVASKLRKTSESEQISSTTDSGMYLLINPTQPKGSAS